VPQINSDDSLKGVNQLPFVNDALVVFCEVGSYFLYIIYIKSKAY